MNILNLRMAIYGASNSKDRSDTNLHQEQIYERALNQLSCLKNLWFFPAILKACVYKTYLKETKK